jgi:hypothetical protein
LIVTDTLPVVAKLVRYGSMVRRVAVESVGEKTQDAALYALE